MKRLCVLFCFPKRKNAVLLQKKRRVLRKITDFYAVLPAGLFPFVLSEEHNLIHAGTASALRKQSGFFPYIYKKGKQIMEKRVLLKAVLTAFAVGSVGLLSACSNKPVAVKVGATAGPHAEVVQAAAKEAEKNGLKVEVVEFSDYLGPNKALAEKAIDIDVYQHEPFLKNFNANQKTDLVPVGRAILMRMGIYSNRVKSVDELQEGATVGVPNDPTNGGRGLQLLEAAGLIKLKEGVGFKATVADVVENPKKLVFKELEAAQLPRSIDDLDIAAITMNYVMSAGLDPAKQGIFLEDKDAPLAVMVIAARPDNKDSDAVKKFVAAYHSEAVKKFIAEKYKGTIVPAWE